MTDEAFRRAVIAAVARGLRAREVRFVYCHVCDWPTTEEGGTCSLCLEDAAGLSPALKPPPLGCHLRLVLLSHGAGGRRIHAARKK